MSSSSSSWRGIAAGLAGGAGILGNVLGYSANMSQAANASAIADYNAKIIKLNADVTERLQVRQSEINQSLLQTQINQSYAIDNQATETLAAGRETIHRIGEEQDKVNGVQRAGFAAGGVLSEGTPLAVLADTASQYARKKTDVWKVAEGQATSLERQAQLTRLGLSAQLETERMNASAAKIGKKIAYSQANLAIAQGDAAASGYKMAAYGSILDGVTKAASAVVAR